MFVPPFFVSQIVDAVHENGSFIYLQLWALGRAAIPDVLQKEGGHPLVAPSPIPLPTKKTKNENTAPSPRALPRALTVEEIEEYVRLYASAAENAVLRAGFDGVEIHAANGYLPDQFLQTNANERTDGYGGSVRNRVRFVLEVTDAVVEAVGAHRVGIRLSPWSTFQSELLWRERESNPMQFSRFFFSSFLSDLLMLLYYCTGMRMPDPVPTFAEVVSRIRDGHPDFAYIHVLEPTAHHRPVGEIVAGKNEDSNKFLRDIWGDRPYIANYDFGRDTAIETVEKEGGLISFGHHFISNVSEPTPDCIAFSKPWSTNLFSTTA
jgi:NADPH2 dehydrogenase